MRIPCPWDAMQFVAFGASLGSTTKRGTTLGSHGGSIASTISQHCQYQSSLLGTGTPRGRAAVR
jgi:hypothetical protein